MAKWTELQLQHAHQHSFRNEASINSSYICGCFHCLSIFKSSSINPDDIILENDGVGTVWCPECGIDSVTGDSIGIRINLGFLNAMEAYYFTSKNDPWDPNAEY
ncbi:hypothetical protein GO003_007395 [Methylicorpusculum oleiharenae]|uniref:hypothetical protein n=1 Tax=Methylicorpusculum oleiharenae TaxID=1338687 RepID=UPI00135A85A3|nr:hypothetical protein [Methylicorpusculum oleiharenae]MCD2450208.1 hypothetical protein [Methylicorpusculum oleiharenae]